MMIHLMNETFFVLFSREVDPLFHRIEHVSMSMPPFDNDSPILVMFSYLGLSNEANNIM